VGKARIATGVLLVTLVTGAVMSYTIASAVRTYQDLGFGAEIDFAYIAQNYMANLDRRPEDAQLIHLIIGSFAAAGLMLSLALSGSSLKMREGARAKLFVNTSVQNIVDAS